MKILTVCSKDKPRHIHPTSTDYYRKVPKFSDTRKLCCNLPKIQTKWQNLLIFRLKGAHGTANSEDPDLGAV